MSGFGGSSERAPRKMVSMPRATLDTVSLQCRSTTMESLASHTALIPPEYEEFITIQTQ